MPSDKEMDLFRKELEKTNLSEVQRKLNQGIYNFNSDWQEKEINRFISDESKKREDNYQETIINLKKQNNVISWLALIISVVSIAIAIFNH